MKKYMLVLLAPALLTGCPPLPASLPALGGGISPGSAPMQAGMLTNVELSQKNYRLVKANAVGTSRGFKLLGLIPIKPISYVDAVTELYEDAGVAEGKAHAVANVVYQRRAPFFILFSLPRVTLRGDLIEFVEASSLESETDSPPEAEAPGLSVKRSQP